VQGLILDVDGVLTDGKLYYGTEGESLRAFSVRDGLGIHFLRDSGVRVGIVSGRDSPTVRDRANELGIDPCLLARPDKYEALVEVGGAWGIDPARIAAIGDDIVDAPLLKAVGLSLAPADAHPDLLEQVDVVLTAPGGEGAVREASELLLRARGDWGAIEKRYAPRKR